MEDFLTVKGRGCVSSAPQGGERQTADRPLLLTGTAAVPACSRLSILFYLGLSPLTGVPSWYT